MAEQFAQIEPKHRAFILRQHLFFVATAAAGGRVNLSPKGLDGLRVLDANTVVYRDHTGSGNETAAHLRDNGRLTLMLCAFEGPPRILRLYGRGRVLARGTPDYARLLASAFDGAEPTGTRQLVLLEVDLVQTSCGFGVPLYDYRGERSALIKWAEAKGKEGLEAYRREHNAHSIDGLPTGLTEGEPATV
jgi:hypothetical protein